VLHKLLNYMTWEPVHLDMEPCQAGSTASTTGYAYGAAPASYASGFVSVSGTGYAATGATSAPGYG
jgi:hypothetical protein